MAGAFKTLMNYILTDAIHDGRLKIIWPDGSESFYGKDATPFATARIKDNATLRRLVANPGLTAGEA